MDHHKALKLAHGLYFGGLILLFVAYGFLKDEPLTFSAAMIPVFLGLGGVVAGLVVTLVFVRCPRCGRSLFHSSRIMLSLPHYCPHCGAHL
ncbi:MAG: hypothetical protein IJ396_07410 [Oscillibacter sp.]|nr:hypothetical protein [Oscillibacter sp.]